MSIQHTVRIHVAQADSTLPVIKSGIKHIPRRLIRFLFGAEARRDRQDRRDQRSEGRLHL